MDSLTMKLHHKFVTAVQTINNLVIATLVNRKICYNLFNKANDGESNCQVVNGHLLVEDTR